MTTASGSWSPSTTAASELIKPYLRGSDLGRWHSDWANLWMIALPSSNDRAWPWADLGEQAEAEFKARYPSLHAT